MKKYTHQELNAMPHSQLLRVAVEHARRYDELVQDQPEKYEWDMETWLEVDPGLCSACMAGAMMFFSFQDEVGPAGAGCFVPRPSEGWAWAERVDNLRMGNFTDLTGDCSPVVSKRIAETFDLMIRSAYILPDPVPGRLTWDGYEKFADLLEEEGL